MDADIQTKVGHQQGVKCTICLKSEETGGTLASGRQQENQTCSENDEEWKGSG